MDEQKRETRLKVLAQIAGICLVGVYVAGFLVVSTYHVRFGIPGFNFLRPKIIAAGVLFFILFALPLWELANLYNWIKPPAKVTPEANHEAQRTTTPELTPFWLHIYGPTMKVFLFLSASFGIAFFVNQFVTVDANLSTGMWAFGCFLITGAA